MPPYMLNKHVITAQDASADMNSNRYEIFDSNDIREGESNP